MKNKRQDAADNHFHISEGKKIGANVDASPWRKKQRQDAEENGLYMLRRKIEASLVRTGPHIVIRATLACWLCLKRYDLVMSLLDGVNLGRPRYWCARCTSTPRIFARLLRERIAALQADVQEADGEEIVFVQQVLARQVGTDEKGIPVPVISKPHTQAPDRLAA